MAIPHFAPGSKRSGLAGQARCLYSDEHGRTCGDDASIWFRTDSGNVYPACEIHWSEISNRQKESMERVHYDRSEIMIAGIMST